MNDGDVGTPLSIGSLLPALQIAIPGVVVSEIEAAKSRTPDWASLIIRHPGKSKFTTFIACCKTTKQGVKELLAKYRGSQNLPVVARASVLVWSQLKFPRSGGDSKFTEAFEAHWSILLTVVRLSRGVIDLPENEKLYSSMGFTRYVGKLRKSHRSA